MITLEWKKKLFSFLLLSSVFNDMNDFRSPFSRIYLVSFECDEQMKNSMRKNAEQALLEASKLNQMMWRSLEIFRSMIRFISSITHLIRCTHNRCWQIANQSSYKLEDNFKLKILYRFVIAIYRIYTTTTIYSRNSIWNIHRCLSLGWISIKRSWVLCS